MKKAVTFFVLMFFVGTLLAQDLIYTISGENNQQNIPLDSILVENLTNNSSILFDDLPVLNDYQINLSKNAFWGATSVNQFETNPGFVEFQNYAGVFTLAYIENSPVTAKFSVFNIKGQKILLAENRKIYPGNSVRFNLGTEGIFVIKVETENMNRSFKAVGANRNSEASVEISAANFEKGILKSTVVNSENEFSFSAGDMIRISAYKTGYYSFPVSFNIVNSDFIHFNFKTSSVENTGISNAYIALDENVTDITFYDIETGNTEITYTGENPDLFAGAIIALDLDSLGYLRKVKNVIENEGVLQVETEPAFMNDVFVDKEIKLNTELIEPGVSLKSTSSLTEISKALTDEQGFIHPVEIIYYNNAGEQKLKSVFNSDVENEGIKIIDFNRDLTTSLYGTSGSNIHLHISEGHALVSADAIYEFDFKFDGELTEDTKVEKGNLRTFKYYLAGQTEFLTKLALDLGASYNSEGEKKLVDLKQVTAKFFVGVVPVWITFDCDIFGNYSFNSDAALHEEWGFKSSHTIQVGGTYNKQADSFTPINEYTPENIVFPVIVEGEINSNVRFELYPRIEAKFYGFFGPYTEIVPFAEGNFNAAYKTEITSKGDETFLAWNSGIDLGLDLRVGSELTFLWGLFDKEFEATEIKCFNTTIWESPANLLFNTVLPAEVDSGQVINLKFNVTDNKGNAVALCPVFITGDSEFSNNILFTDEEGNADVDWTLSGGEGENEFTATIYKADGNAIQEITESVNVLGGEVDICNTDYSYEVMDEISAMNDAALGYALNINPQTCVAYKEAIQAVLDILALYVDCDNMTEEERSSYDMTVWMTNNQLDMISCN